MTTTPSKVLAMKLAIAAVVMVVGVVVGFERVVMLVREVVVVVGRGLVRVVVVVVKEVGGEVVGIEAVVVVVVIAVLPLVVVLLLLLPLILLLVILLPLQMMLPTVQKEGLSSCRSCLETAWERSTYALTRRRGLMELLTALTLIRTVAMSLSLTLLQILALALTLAPSAILMETGWQGRREGRSEHRRLFFWSCFKNLRRLRALEVSCF